MKRLIFQVYGVAQGIISIGYQHSTCQNIVWETQTALLQGYNVDISDVGGWSLDIHHHYNFHEGINAIECSLNVSLSVFW